MNQPSPVEPGLPAPLSCDGMLAAAPDGPQRFLPSLAALLRTLEQSLRQWFNRPYPLPLMTLQKALMQSLFDDLRRQLELLDAEHPLLLVVLMGGTGVGKSTLLNALAGAPIAPADIQRPTTRDPVVYLHHSVRPERLDPALRQCRLIPHDREQLRYKVLVDTPDLDSNIPENRERLAAILPVADIVLYVGSQEKYHDRLGWELFRQHRHRRAFAFVLNKWDRCLTEERYGLRPDLDWLRDLQAEGFEQPRLFRTAARKWLEAQQQGLPSPSDLPPDEQFHELRHWLEWGLTRREIEAIKARGIEQLLDALDQALHQLMPPDPRPLLPKLQQQWQRLLEEASQQQAAGLIRAFDAYQTTIELYFQSRDQQRFRGFMAAYLRATRWLRHSGARLRHPLHAAFPSFTPARSDTTELPESLHQLLRWDLSSSAALPTILRLQDLPHRLLLAVQQTGLPSVLFQHELDTAAPAPQLSQQLQEAILQSLHQVEHDFLHTTGPRRWLRHALVLTANYAPELAFLATAAILLWQFIVQQQTPGVVQLALVILIPLLVLVTLHLLLHLLLPFNWSILRQKLEHHLQHQLLQRWSEHWLPLLEAIAHQVDEERRHLQALQQDLRCTREWITRHDVQAEITHLYGK